MNKLGLHIQRLTSDILNLIEHWQPAVVVWVDPNQDGVDEIRRRSPGTFIVGRRYEGGMDWQANALKQFVKRVLLDAVRGLELALPSGWFTKGGVREKVFSAVAGVSDAMFDQDWDIYQAAVSPESWADQCAAMAKCDAWICWNEPFGHDHEHLFAPFDEWQCRFRERMLTHGMEAVAFNFGTGNFTAAPDRKKVSDCFPKTCASFKYFGIHEYYWPDLQGGQMWHTLRFPAWYEDIRHNPIQQFVSINEDGFTVNLTRNSEPQFIVTECGLTQAVHEGRPDRGWRDDVSDAPTDESYLAGWDWYNRELCKRAYVKGAAIFNFGGHGWETFEHENHPVRFQMAALDAPGPAPPNGGNDMDYKVYDRDGKELTGQAALDMVNYYRLEISPPPDLKAGDRYFKIVALREKTGTSAFIYRVVNQDGSRRAQQQCAWWWPGMAAGDNDIALSYATDRESEADLGVTNDEGEMGPGMGTGAYFHPDDPEHPRGPHRAWVRHPEIKSDELLHIGMRAGTNHDHMDCEWKEVVHEDGGPTPPDGELKPEYLETVEQLDSATVMFGMAIILDSDAAEEWIWDTRALLTGPGVHDIVNPFAWTYPTTGEPCSVAAGCCDYGSDDPNEERQYSVSLIRLKPGGYDTLIGPRSLMVKPLGVEEKRLVVRVYRLVGEGPTPPPDGHAAKLHAVADALDKQSAVVRKVADAVNSGGLSGLVLRFEDGSEREVEL